MFGFVTPGPGMEEPQRQRYRAHYCGLCRRLGTEYGLAGRLTLTYDMTFLAILLGALYPEAEEQGVLRCPANPLRKCGYAGTTATGYAADMNVVLAYYKYRDDWQDDRSLPAWAKSRLLAKRAERAQTAWPRQREAIARSLSLLGQMERDNELNPDLPANVFAGLMSHLFVWREDALAPLLSRMGAALGRFIYLMDASLDLRSDLRRQRYNPLTAMGSIDHTPMLTMLISECTQVFEALPLHKDRDILRNILYEGIWVIYQTKREEKEQNHE